MFGEEWTARTIAAVIIGLTILGVSVFGVTQGLESIKEHRANADTRRVAGMLEAVDHKPGTVARLNFVQDYAIEIADGRLTMQAGSVPARRHKINLHNDISTGGSLDSMGYVCIKNTGDQLEVSSDCSFSTTSN